MFCVIWMNENFKLPDSALCKDWFVDLTWELRIALYESDQHTRRVLKCVFVYDGVWLTWGDPVQLTGWWNPVINYVGS